MGGMLNRMHLRKKALAEWEAGRHTKCEAGIVEGMLKAYNQNHALVSLPFPVRIRVPGDEHAETFQKASAR